MISHIYIPVLSVLGFSFMVALICMFFRGMKQRDSMIQMQSSLNMPVNQMSSNQYGAPCFVQPISPQYQTGPQNIYSIYSNNQTPYSTFQPANEQTTDPPPPSYNAVMQTESTKALK